MIYELVYTSVPRGLRPGSKGYCTVLTTDGIASALQDRLEGLCGYRHLFDPGSSQNPVNFMHHKIQLAGNTWHVLSRVSDAGSDYSQRSNLLAHHVAISQDEISKIGCSPATLMRHPSFFITAWDGEPRRVSESETRSRLARLSNSVKVAKEWEKVTGDAGYAGLLAERTVESGHRSIDLVYPLGIDILSIIEEAALLLPAHEQWQTTFNSFFTKSIEDCKWKFYCDAATESKIYIGSAFDLTNLKNAHTEIDASSPLVIAARTGHKSKPQARPIIEQVRTQREKPDSLLEKKALKNQEDDLDIFKNVQQDLRQKGTYRDPAFIKNDPPARRPPQPPSLSINNTIPIIEDEFVNSGNNFESDLKTSFGKPLRKKSKKPQYKIAVIATTILTLLIICTMTFVFILKARVPKVTELDSTNNSTASVNEQVKKQEDKTRQKEETQAKTDQIAKDDTIKKGENSKPIASAKLEPDTKQETPMPKVAEINRTEVSPGNNPSPRDMPKAKSPNEPVASQKSDIVAKPHSLDKSIIIADLYSKLKELKTSLSNNTVNITIPPEVKLPEALQVNYLLCNNIKKELMEPQNQLRVKSVQGNSITIKIPQIVKDLEPEDLLSICFSTITWKSIGTEEVYNLQLFNPNPIECEIKNKKMIFSFQNITSEMLRQIVENLMNTGNAKMPNEVFHCNLTPVSHINFFGFNKNKYRNVPFLECDPIPVLTNNYKSDNFHESKTKIGVYEIKYVKLRYPILYGEVMPEYLKTLQMNVNNENIDKKWNELANFFPNAIFGIQKDDLKSQLGAVYYFLKDEYYSEVKPESRYPVKSEKFDLPDASKINKGLIDQWNNSNRSQDLDKQYQVAMRGVLNDSIKNILPFMTEIQSYLTEHPSPKPHLTFQLTMNEPEKITNHWWYNQATKSNPKLDDQKEILKQTRILIGDFQEKKEDSK